MSESFSLIDIKSTTINFYEQVKWSYIFIGQDKNQYKFIFKNISHSKKMNTSNGDKVIIFGKKFNPEVLNNHDLYISKNIQLIDLKKDYIKDIVTSSNESCYIYNIDENDIAIKNSINFLTSFSNFIFVFDDTLDFEMNSRNDFAAKALYAHQNQSLFFFIINESLRKELSPLSSLQYKKLIFNNSNCFFGEIIKISPFFNKILFELNHEPMEAVNRLTELIDSNPLYIYRKIIEKNFMAVQIDDKLNKFKNLGKTINLDFLRK